MTREVMALVAVRFGAHFGAAEGFAEITDFELALYYRDEAPASTAILAERLIAYCHLEP